MSEKVFFNYSLVDIADANISAADAGFLYGAGLFETMRSYNGLVLGLDEHLDRLFASAEKLVIYNNYEKDFITGAIYKLLQANELTDARIRLTLTGGSISAEPEEKKSTLVITATEIHPYPDDYYKNGVMVTLCPYRQNPYNPTSGHKTLNYFPRLMALDMARKYHAAESLWFTVDNALSEGCISNVFLVKNSAIYTPKLQTPILPGVTRKFIHEIADENSIEFIEKDLYIDDCLSADEIFLSNSIMQIMPVARIEKHVVGKGKTGELTKKLIKLFDEYVKKLCELEK
jgi:branched-chain amino acid aminotransferase